MVTRTNSDINGPQLGLVGVAVTASQNGADMTNPYGKGIKVTLVTTAIGTGSVTMAIQYKDPGSGAYTNLLTSAAVTTNTTTVLTVYPGIAVAANVSANDVLPRVWRIALTANNANPANFNVGATLIV